jgi:hypothetical protein
MRSPRCMYIPPCPSISPCVPIILLYDETYETTLLYVSPPASVHLSVCPHNFCMRLMRSPRCMYLLPCPSISPCVPTIFLYDETYEITSLYVYPPASVHLSVCPHIFFV